jgi:hypothetical protein
MTARTPIAQMVEAMAKAGAGIDSIIAAIEAHEMSPAEKAQALILREDPKPPREKRGTRLSATWRPSAQEIEYARERGLSDSAIANEAEKFGNYWRAKSGTNAVKRDWEATWRNWIITATERRYARSHSRSRPGSPAAAGRAPTGADAILTSMGRLADRIDERKLAEGQDRQVPRGRDTADGDGPYR